MVMSLVLIFNFNQIMSSPRNLSHGGGPVDAKKIEITFISTLKSVYDTNVT